VRRRFPRALIVAGGEHITALAEHTLETCPEVDLCVLGEGEEAMADIANAFDNDGDFAKLRGLVLRIDGEPHRTAKRERVRAIDKIPAPNWEIAPIDAYLDNGLGYGVDLGRSMPIIATRGCPYQCTFCSNPTMWTTRWLARDPAAVLDEIEGYIRRYRATNIDFYDLTAIVKKTWIVDFCKLIAERGLSFTWQLPSGTRSEAIDEEVCDWLYRSGCRNMTYAPESGSPAVLARIKKKVKLSRLVKSMRAAIKAGMNVKTNIIVGFPDERRSEILETIVFILRMSVAGVHDVSVSLFSPYPGSELFDGLQANGKIGAIDDEFLLSLAAYTDVTNTVSWCENLSSREIGAWRILALLLFYGVQYAVRPWRLARMISNLINHRQESRLDKSLQDFFQRHKPHQSTAHKTGAIAGHKS
jgi:radical SAM superfamily enzyme YgiQ (UPF0313 family)